jgi:hypothetical protein
MEEMLRTTKMFPPTRLMVNIGLQHFGKWGKTDGGNIACYNKI